MSYDLDIGSVREPDLPEVLRRAANWLPDGGGWRFEGHSWQIVVAQPTAVLPEDVPIEVLGELAGIAHLTLLNLEPVTAPKSAHALLRRTARSIARSGHGVVHDRQTSTVESPSGVKRFAAPPREKTFSRLAMTWWFLDGPLVGREGISALLDVLETRLPEALPRRYGLYEPPKHQFDSGGRGPFEAFLLEHLDDLVVWYPHRPVISVSVNARPGDGLKLSRFGGQVRT